MAPQARLDRRQFLRYLGGISGLGLAVSCKLDLNRQPPQGDGSHGDSAPGVDGSTREAGTPDRPLDRQRDSWPGARDVIKKDVPSDHGPGMADQPRDSQAPKADIKLAPDLSCPSCAGSCSGTCTGSCTSGCQGSCTGVCTNKCVQGFGCGASCSSTCSGKCNISCSATCSDACASTCVGNCMGTACSN